MKHRPTISSVFQIGRLKKTVLGPGIWAGSQLHRSRRARPGDDSIGYLGDLKHAQTAGVFRPFACTEEKVNHVTKL